MQNVEGTARRPLPALFLPPTVHLAVQAVQRIGQPAHVVDDAQRHRPSPYSTVPTSLAISPEASIS